ncbi:hypothetical protein CC78DRAFT_487054 [Lojkania enalia]|uniref:Mmc1 C-terminal domain-containing protein n=1 Tax=Lojkania enalia TaxID=147567 RepID=A0A9P4NA77_9PLEO|nr:hypothetical protein CC78DRAFT_487054 [Didymosphaeria enalia]
MPPWVAYVPRSTSLLNGRAIERLSLSFSCRNVTIANFYLRHASTHISPTAINVRPNIPPRNEEVYNALSQLNIAAAPYVNISRLQLALRGLAVQYAVVRIAILSLNRQRNARRLARLLLADPLGDEGQWEKKLEHEEDECGRAVLLRYGDEFDSHTPSPLYKILSVPSQFLRSYNLEILVSTLNTNISSVRATSTTEGSKDAILVPKLQAPTARGMPVPYPVHKALVLGDGLESAVTYGKFTANDTIDTGAMLKVAINLPPTSLEVGVDEAETYSLVNVDTGTKALAKFRESIANSEYFERGWFRSGLPPLSKWLVHNLQPSEPIKPVIKDLIASIVDDVDIGISEADALQQSEAASSITHEQTSESILKHLENWAEKSHTELRDQLDDAFATRNWRKLAWWKLFWRVDDVGMITEEIIERRWLVDAEKNSVYLAGRMNQAGFPETTEDISKMVTPASEQTQPPSIVDKPKTGILTQVNEIIPWPSQIATGRAILLKDTIPPLQALAQRLILNSLSNTALSSALSALLYVSVPTFSPFEAGAVAALGLVYSLRRMQKLWERARETWQSEVREEGRRTLKQTEDMVRLIVRSTKKPVEDEGVRERKVAREAVLRVRDALRRM